MAQRISARFSIAILAVLATLAVAFWYSQHAIKLEAERAAKMALDQLGAVVVMDGRQQHVASVNLSTLRSRAQLDQALTAIADLPELASLDASRTGIRDDDLITISHLKQLNSLTLNQTEIGDAGVMHLARLDRLKSLNLAKSKVTSAALSSIARLSSLTILDLTGTQISSQLEHLSELAQLEWLVLRGLKLEKGALESLAQCPALHRVSLEESSYPKGSLDALLDSSPSLAIDK